MARIRTIKPEFFTSLTIADLTPEQRLTFIGLWTHVDDAGRCVDDARLIKAAVWPLDDRTAADIESDLRALTESSLITRYILNQRRYLAVRSWDEHQKINRPTPSKLPAPDQADSILDPGLTCGDDDSLTTHGVITEDSPLERKGKEQGTGKGKEAGNAPDGAAIPGQTCVLDAAEQADDDTSPDPASRDDVEQICRYLADRLVATGSKRPRITAKWRDAARLLIDRDGVTVDQALKAIDWAHANDFWQAHILTPMKLREKYETLRRQAMAPSAGRSAPHTPFTNPTDPSAYYGEL